MALDLSTSKVVRFNLGTVLAGYLTAFNRDRIELQSQDELDFQKQVSEKGLSSSEQLAYRKAQLEKEKGRDVPDQNFIKSLNSEVVTLKKASRFEAVRNAYQSSLDDVLSKRKTWQDHLTTLQQELTDNQDPDLQQEIRSQITQAEQNIATADSNLLDNQVTLATKDGSVDLLNTTIDKVKEAKAKALGMGDKTTASAMDLRIQSLTQSLQSLQIQDKVNTLAIKKSRKASAAGFLQDLSDEVSAADSQTPIVINGTRYTSAKDYWTQQRESYISTNFFTDLQKEYTDYTGSVSAVNGTVPKPVLDNMQSDFVQLAAKPELAPYVSRLDITKNTVLANAVTKTAQSIVNQYTVDNNYNKALDQLNNLEKTYNISTVDSAQMIIKDVAKTKGALFNNLLNDVQGLVSQGLSYSAATAKVLGAIGTGQVTAPDYSATDVVTKSPADLLKAAPGTTQAQVKETVPVVPGTSPDTAPVIPTTTPAQAAGATKPPATPAPTVGQVLGASITAPKVSDIVGRRISKVDNKTTEYFDKSNGTGIGDQAALGKFLGNKGVTGFVNNKGILDFGKLNKQLDQGL